MDTEKFELVRAKIHSLLPSPFRDACTDPNIDDVTMEVIAICDSEPLHKVGMKTIDFGGSDE